MKRIIVFLAFMNFLLFGGGQYLSAGTHQNSDHTYGHKHHIKYTNQEQGNSIIEEADLDLDEEFSGDAASDGTSVSKIFTSNYSLLDGWYLSLSDRITVNYHRHFKFFVPFCGNSNPLYITQRVLRI
ncbi:hypothetical protein DMB65_17085 [Flavobacterium cheongpyeongense]|jgi:hypothetical protein|uniref:Uncharacterized protein n=1 Tax=Flavobacterium cheongpyeongense TaxID=2212651 RepID=A0A2V4BKM3_9FLAO|nr:hypothetical protein [Flavobacterium cheongpyeongense]PXY39535.1 hypothetical protein DMB65_17085 [Flavobacterium cheongpyeongense]